MNILVSPNAFKETLSAPEAALAMKEGVRDADPSVNVMSLPVADGGDGTLETFVHATEGKTVPVQVTGPRQKSVEAEFGILGNGETAVVEMARASGLALLGENQRNPMKTTTYGTGELIRKAIEEGCQTIIVGIGGSATVDGGTGMARALGYRFLDEEGNEVEDGGGNLDQIEEIQTDQVMPALSDVDVFCACDVNNLLTGARGASRVFGPQKGATNRQVEILEENLTHFQELLQSEMGIDVSELEGGGAAGGLGAGLYAFCGAELKSGVELVFDHINLEEQLEHSDLVLSGEGEVDPSSLEGKAAVEVARRAMKHDVPCFLICGYVERGRYEFMENLNNAGVDAIFPIPDGPMRFEECLKKSYTLVKTTTRNAVSAFLAGRNSAK